MPGHEPPIVHHVDGAPPDRPALIELAGDGSRQIWEFGAISVRSARLAGALHLRGVRHGDVVATLVTRPSDLVLISIACMRIGAIVLTCRPAIPAELLAARCERARVRMVVAEASSFALARHAAQLGTMPAPPLLASPYPDLLFAPIPPVVTVHPTDPAALWFDVAERPQHHSHEQLFAPHDPATASLRATDVVWAIGEDPSAPPAWRDWAAPWARGATALMAGSSPAPREVLRTITRESVSVLWGTADALESLTRARPLPRAPWLRDVRTDRGAADPEVLTLLSTRHHRRRRPGEELSIRVARSD